MKKVLALTLALVLTLSMFTGCTKKPTDGATTGGTAKPEDIRLLLMSSAEKEGNVMRDQLTKAGFNVILNVQPDYSSFLTVQDAGEYDLAITGWTTVTGNPDYAVRSLFQTGGDYNKQPVNDEVVNELIDKAAKETPEVYAATYKELENRLVTEKAYIVPMFSTLRMMAYDKTLIDEKTMRHSKSRSMVWEDISYLDKALNDTRPLIMHQTMSTLTSMHPIRGNDGSINQLNTNLYVRLINLTDEDEIEAEGSLSHQYAIADGNMEYYFLLRDDINFAKVEDKKAVDTGVMVGAEDVIFTLEQAKNKDSVPIHKTYTLHSSMEKMEIITDIEALKAVKSSGSDKTIFDTLSEKAPTPVTTLTADTKAVDNKAGKYQVVKITTDKPFPQVLNFLAHQSAGIVSKNQVTSINSKVDVAKYDPTKDILYGDQSVVTEGATYNNHLWTSGPYTMIMKNDYEVKFEKSPAYLVGTVHEPKIKTITYKFIKDNDSATSALRSGEIDVMPFVPENNIKVLEGDAKFFVSKRSSNAAAYGVFNLMEGNKFQNEDLRKAVLYAISQDDYVAVFDGLKGKLYSTLSTLVDTGNVLVQDLAKSQGFLIKYQTESAAK